MLMGSPDVTPYDLRFRFLKIPVRVHPLFWLVMLLISGKQDDLKLAAVFVACAFLSVLVHELGHAMASRLMGDEPIGIVLYAMGGFCAFHADRLSPWRRIFVLIAGPGAGFLLAFLVLVVTLSWTTSSAPFLNAAIRDLLFINIVWGILNLFPLWPLDGGQILGNLLGMVNSRNGQRWAHVVSLLTAGGLAIWLASLEDYMMALWFGYFALINYQMLQALYVSSRYPSESEW
ncbi:MAG: site-2 protease family protein [Isosphaeraceae bacterium]